MTNCRDAYEVAISNITYILRDLQTYLDTARSYETQMVTGFQGSGDASAGMIVTQFDTAVGDFRCIMDSLFVDQYAWYSMYYHDLQNKLNLMQDRLPELIQKCADEKSQKRKIPLSELSF
jgi:hypothetical protein